MGRGSDIVKNPVIHLLWIIATLVFAIAAMIVYRPGGQVVYNYISFASAISSIVLAFVAIVYSIVSNRGFGESLNAIQASARDVQAETRELKVISGRFSDNAAALVEQISLVPTSVEKMSDTIGTKIDSLTLVVPSQNQDTLPSSSVGDPAGKAVGSVISLCVLHWASISRKDVPINEALPNVVVRNFVLGYINCLKNFNVCDADIESVGDKFRVDSLGSLDLKGFVDQVLVSKHKSFLENALPAARFFELDATIKQMEAALEDLEMPIEEDETGGTEPKE